YRSRAGPGPLAEIAPATPRFLSSIPGPLEGSYFSISYMGRNNISQVSALIAIFVRNQTEPPNTSLVRESRVVAEGAGRRNVRPGLRPWLCLGRLAVRYHVSDYVPRPSRTPSRVASFCCPGRHSPRLRTRSRRPRLRARPRRPTGLGIGP